MFKDCNSLFRYSNCEDVTAGFFAAFFAAALGMLLATSTEIEGLEGINNAR